MQELLVLLPGSSSGGQTALPGGSSCLGLSAPCLPLYLPQLSQWQLSSLPSSGGTFPRKAGEPDPLLGQQRCSMMTSFTKPLEQLLCTSPFIYTHAMILELHPAWMFLQDGFVAGGSRCGVPAWCRYAKQKEGLVWSLPAPVGEHIQNLRVKDRQSTSSPEGAAARLSETPGELLKLQI